ncbi:hypothetical protein DFH06DRAFT_1222442 [Mycena polygramma]|nr:hypothetical protein DFH06DRAFT_1222442 [Mycena polygramma]
MGSCSRNSISSLAHSSLKKSAATLAPTDIERLAFWTTDKICGNVRRCIVILKTTSNAPVVEFRLDGPSPFVSATVQAFSRFSNLQHLTLMDPTGRAELPGLGLASLPYLRSLDIAVAQLTRPTQPASTLLQLEYISYIQYPPLRPTPEPSARCKRRRYRPWIQRCSAPSGYFFRPCIPLGHEPLVPSALPRHRLAYISPRHPRAPPGSYYFVDDDPVPLSVVRWSTLTLGHALPLLPSCTPPRRGPRPANPRTAVAV